MFYRCVIFTLCLWYLIQLFLVGTFLLSTYTYVYLNVMLYIKVKQLQPNIELSKFIIINIVLREHSWKSCCNNLIASTTFFFSNIYKTVIAITATIINIHEIIYILFIYKNINKILK